MTDNGIVWLPLAIEGLHDRYEVSNTGLVRRIGKDTPMKTTSAKNGYPIVNLTFADSRQKVFLVHRLIAITFLGQPEGYVECCHWDGDRTNNHVDNLRWDTKSANARDAIRHGTAARGTRNNFSKLNEYAVEAIRLYIRDGLTDLQIAKRFKVSSGTIRAIRIGQSWSTVRAAG